MSPETALWAVIDPNWGKPVAIPETLSDTPEGAIEKVLLHERHALYSGASLHTVPPRPGKWIRLQEHGYRITRVGLEILD